MSGLAELVAAVHSAGEIGFVVFLRVGAAVSLLPAFGEKSIPARIRLVLALAFTAIVAPSAAPTIHPALGAPTGVPELWLGETLVGLMLGLSIRLTVMVLQMAGTIAAQSMSLAQVFVNAGAEPVAVVGELLVLAGLALAVILGLHVELARCLIDSYRDFAPGDLPKADQALTWAVTRIADSFALALQLALPFVAGALIYNVALGVINKAMPQLMVVMIGAPALTLGGLFMLMLAAPVAINFWIRHLGDVLSRPFGH